MTKKCSKIETCKTPRRKDDFQYFCLENPKKCCDNMVVTEKTPKQWLSEKKD